METAETLQAICERLDALLDRTPQRFLSLASAAAYCDLSEDSLRRLIERGDLTPHRPVRGKILIDRQQLDALILGSAGDVRGSRGSSARARSDTGRFGAQDKYRGHGPAADAIDSLAENGTAARKVADEPSPA